VIACFNPWRIGRTTLNTLSTWLTNDVGFFFVGKLLKNKLTQSDFCFQDGLVFFSGSMRRTLHLQVMHWHEVFCYFCFFGHISSEENCGGPSSILYGIGPTKRGTRYSSLEDCPYYSKHRMFMTEAALHKIPENCPCRISWQVFERRLASQVAMIW